MSDPTTEYVSLTPASEQSQNPAVRHSVDYLQEIYDTPNHPDLDVLKDVLNAFAQIKAVVSGSSNWKNSFEFIAGLHGSPFLLRSDSKADYWGGWCNHANVLFPTWHRAYCAYIEQAMQSFVPGVGLPFYDECSESAKQNGIPSLLTMKTLTVDGQTMDNPLFSYTLQNEVLDDDGDLNIWRKPVGYETVRYPFSGLVGNKKFEALSESYNQALEQNDPVGVLNANVRSALFGETVTDSSGNPQEASDGVLQQFSSCLSAPNYNVFSNTSSSRAYYAAVDGYTFPLEQPHNDMHVAIGGFPQKRPTDDPDVSKTWEDITDEWDMSSGDMGENNTAAFDPIFFLHHCFIDYMFWRWQVVNGSTDSIVIEPTLTSPTDPNVKIEDPGTSTATVDDPTSGSAPVTGQDFGQPLTSNTDLQPFLYGSSTTKFWNSNDVANISSMNYSYGPGSHDDEAKHLQTTWGNNLKVIISGIRRDLFAGSFIVHAYAKTPTQRFYLGSRSVLSRFQMSRCRNCQSHLDTDLFFKLPDNAKKFYKAGGKLDVKVMFFARRHGSSKREMIRASGTDFEFSIRT